jgi:hypothetical protein
LAQQAESSFDIENAVLIGKITLLKKMMIEASSA